MLTDSKIITPELLESAMDYGSYRNLVIEKYEQGETTGPDNSPAMMEYTKLNLQRMKRWDKTTKISETLASVLENQNEKWVWLVITEGWCGDAAQNLPAIEKMAELSSNIELKLILRDENLEIMDAYLTNGGRSIPKLVCLKADTLEELGTWGPRPAPVQEKTMTWKNNPAGMSADDFKKEIHTWYAKDKTLTLQAEFLALIKKWEKQL